MQSPRPERRPGASLRWGSIFLNFVLPILGVALTCYFDPRIESVLTALVVGCFLNCATAIYHIENLRPRLLKQVHEEILNTVQPLGQYIGTYAEIDDPAARRRIHEINHLHKHVAEVTHFSSENLLAKYLMLHHAAEYALRLSEIPQGKLLLPSNHRQELALEGIRRARISVFAISSQGDRWTMNRNAAQEEKRARGGLWDEYETENFQAAKRGIDVRRIFVIAHTTNRGEIRDVARRQRHNGIKVLCADLADIQPAIAGLAPNHLPLTNLLIRDDDLATYANVYGREHEGYAVTGPDPKQFEAAYRLLWDQLKGFDLTDRLD